MMSVILSWICECEHRRLIVAKTGRWRLKPVIIETRHSWAACCLHGELLLTALPRGQQFTWSPVWLLLPQSTPLWPLCDPGVNEHNDVFAGTRFPMWEICTWPLLWPPLLCRIVATADRNNDRWGRGCWKGKTASAEWFSCSIMALMTFSCWISVT